MKRFNHVIVGALLLFAAVSCEDKKEAKSENKEVKTTLKLAGTPGEKIWQANCRVCHFQGIAGAPKFGNKELWAPRISQGLDTLYSHAKNGYTSTGGDTQMPPRGGNDKLTDEEVEMAVRYMVVNSQ